MRSFQVFYGSSAKRRASRRQITLVFLAAALLASPALMAANGNLDTSFNGGVFDLPIGDRILSLTLQDDGRVLLAGQFSYTTDPSTEWMLARRNTDGTPDASFGVGTGQVAIPVGGDRPSGRDSGIAGVVVQSDGKILGVGWGLDRTGTIYDVHLIRWNPDGSLDTSYGKTGKLTTSLGTSGQATAVALQQDGKAVVTAYQVGASPSDPTQPVVLRYTKSGGLDASFGTAGVFRLPGSVPAAEFGVTSSATIQPDGKILVGMGSEQNNHPEIMRLTATGQLDSTFGSGGIVALNVGSSAASGITVQPDGKILLSSWLVGGPGKVFRLLASGALDTSFNGQGWIDLVVFQTIENLALAPTGQVLVVGFTGGGGLWMARLTSNGQLDASFTNGTRSGMLETDSPDQGNPAVVLQGVNLQPDGRFVVAGGPTAARFQGDALDLLPKTAAFTSATGVPLSTVQVSNVITISGLTTGAWVPIQVFGGSYSINGDPFTSMMGYVHDGDQVMVDHTSAATHGTSVTTTLRVGGLSAPNSPWILRGSKVIATFTSTTQ